MQHTASLLKINDVLQALQNDGTFIPQGVSEAHRLDLYTSKKIGIHQRNVRAVSDIALSDTKVNMSQIVDALRADIVWSCYIPNNSSKADLSYVAQLINSFSGRQFEILLYKLANQLQIMHTDAKKIFSEAVAEQVSANRQFTAYEKELIAMREAHLNLNENKKDTGSKNLFSKDLSAQRMRDEVMIYNAKQEGSSDTIHQVLKRVCSPRSGSCDTQIKQERCSYTKGDLIIKFQVKSISVCSDMSEHAIRLLKAAGEEYWDTYCLTPAKHVINHGTVTITLQCAPIAQDKPFVQFLAPDEGQLLLNQSGPREEVRNGEEDKMLLNLLRASLIDASAQQMQTTCDENTQTYHKRTCKSCHQIREMSLMNVEKSDKSLMCKFCYTLAGGNTKLPNYYDGQYHEEFYRLSKLNNALESPGLYQPGGAFQTVNLCAIVAGRLLENTLDNSIKALDTLSHGGKEVEQHDMFQFAAAVESDLLSAFSLTDFSNAYKKERLDTTCQDLKNAMSDAIAKFNELQGISGDMLSSQAFDARQVYEEGALTDQNAFQVVRQLEQAPAVNLDESMEEEGEEEGEENADMEGLGDQKELEDLLQPDTAAIDHEMLGEHEGGPEGSQTGQASSDPIQPIQMPEFSQKPAHSTQSNLLMNFPNKSLYPEVEEQKAVNQAQSTSQVQSHSQDFEAFKSDEQ